MKDAKGHGSDARGGMSQDALRNAGDAAHGKVRGMPIAGHPYHTKTNDELQYIAKDASEAAKAQRGMASEGKYLDQVNDAATVLGWRSRGGKDLSQSRATDVAAQHGIDTSHLVGYVPPSRPGDQSPTHNSQGHEWGSPAALADFKAEHGGPANKGQLARIARFRKAVGRGE